jgi:hypothetical protein
MCIRIGIAQARKDSTYRSGRAQDEESGVRGGAAGGGGGLGTIVWIMGPFVSEGWRLVHLHGETIQRRLLFRDALMEILALKISEVRRKQPDRGYEAACRHWPGESIPLRQGGRIIEDSMA